MNREPARHQELSVVENYKRRLVAAVILEGNGSDPFSSVPARRTPTHPLTENDFRFYLVSSSLTSSVRLHGQGILEGKEDWNSF